MPVQPTYPGVYVQEAPSGVRGISGVATSVAAFVGMAPSGPVNVPTEVLNARAFDAAFGGSADVGEMVHQVRQFFLNGGPRAWIVRTAQAAGDGSALMATSTIRTEDEAVSAFTVAAKNAGSAGNNVRVEVDYNTPSPERTFNLSAYATTVNSAGGIEKVLETRHLNLSIDPRSARYAPTIVNAGNPHVSLSAMPAVPANLTGFSQSARSALRLRLALRSA